ERLIAQFQERLRTKFPDGKGNPAEPAQELYHLLVEPLEPTLEQHGVQTLIYAADNQLRYIPLAALFDGNQWLIERFQINNVTAASLTDFATSSRSRGFTSVLAAAYSETPAPFSVGETPYRFDGLKHTIDEVSVVASLGETARTLVNREFNLTSVEANLEAHQFIHFATHAAFVDGAPEESFILLGDEGRLSIRQINDWNLENIELIVLSACETAVSSDFGSGEEILGFGYQIQRAGARGGVATLWLVKDQSTLPFMRFFYAHIKGGELNYAEALRAAQLSLIYGSRPREDGTYEANDSSSPQEGVYSVYSHPHHWAPFILIGNGL
ncbi:MAG: CHAT domain-containing protein, partial [Cyanobacteria bacterium P01_A01_bin.17]